jgi:hypothetical protein
MATLIPNVLECSTPPHRLLLDFNNLNDASSPSQCSEQEEMLLLAFVRAGQTRAAYSVEVNSMLPQPLVLPCAHALALPYAHALARACARASGPNL